jgi:hypothetical protein
VQKHKKSATDLAKGLSNLEAYAKSNGKKVSTRASIKN